MELPANQKMNAIQSLIEREIDAAANPFNAIHLHNLSREIETCDYLQPLAKELLQRRVRMCLESVSNSTFQETPCGWRKELA